MDNDNSDLAISIINKLAKDHDLNITIITARPSAKDTGKKDNQQDTGQLRGFRSITKLQTKTKEIISMKTLLITKPRLAGRLFKAGYKGDETVNPFHPELKAWEFDLDEKARDIIEDYYYEINKPLPATIKKWIEDELL